MRDFSTCVFSPSPVLPFAAFSCPRSPRLRFSLLQALCSFQNLRRCGSHPVILRQINPTHCASRVDQELCRPGNVVSIFPLALVHEIVPLDYFGVWIGKQWEGVARFLCQIA